MRHETSAIVERQKGARFTKEEALAWAQIQYYAREVILPTLVEIAMRDDGNRYFMPADLQMLRSLAGADEAGGKLWLRR